MPRIAPLDPDKAGSKVADSLDAVKKQVGSLPNIYRTLAHSPTALNGYLAFGKAAEDGVLDASQREIVALAVAQANGCAYCLSAHTLVGGKSGLDHDTVRAARKADADATGDLALARFAREVVEARGWVGDAQLKALHEAGFADDVAIEVVALVAMNTLTNYVNHLAGTEVDFPAVAVELEG